MRRGQDGGQDGGQEEDRQEEDRQEEDGQEEDSETSPEDGDSADELRSKTKNCTNFSKFSKDKVVCLLIVYTS